MAIGMTYDQYWYGDPLMARAFYQTEQLRMRRINEVSWLNGAYTFIAVSTAIGNALREKGKKPDEYPDKPMDLFETKETDLEKAQREDREAAWAQAYMSNLVLIGKDWNKKE